jgi:YHS domain-containing protein
MEKLLISILLITMTGVFIAGSAPVYAAEQKEKAGKAQTMCPVLGGELDKRLYTDYKGYRIYFCCAGCPEEFKKNPEKYMKKLKDSGVVLEKTPDAK